MLEKLSARVIAILVGAALLLGLLAYGVHLWTQARTNVAKARLSTNQAQAAQETGAEAVNTVGNVAATAEADRKTSQEAQDAINRAEAGNSNDAADAAVCSLRLYHDTERCRQLRALHP